MISFYYIMPWEARSFRHWLLDRWRHKFARGVCVLGLIIEQDDCRYA
jgi:hypothetical protein